MLELKEQGENQRWEVWKQLNTFVAENFDLLFEGAERLDCSIDADYYAPRRIQVNNSRISGRCAGQEHYAHEYLYIKRS